MRRYRSLKTMRHRLIELILDRSFQYAEQPDFTLASGKKSNFYFNCKPTTLSPEGMFLVGHLLYDLVRSRKRAKIQAVGGLTLGADPVAGAIAYTSYLKGEPLESFVVRKEPKKHGTMQWIEGQVKKGGRVVIVEDVITTGGSTEKAIVRARECGLRVEGVVILVDRQEGGREKIREMKIPCDALLTREEIFEAYRSFSS